MRSVPLQNLHAPHRAITGQRRVALLGWVESPGVNRSPGAAATLCDAWCDGSCSGEAIPRFAGRASAARPLIC